MWAEVSGHLMICATNAKIRAMRHGDYKRLLSSDKLHSVTNYQLYKGLWSSLNDLNMFELAYTLDEQRAKYAHHQLFTFVDNHDVTRAASVLKNPAHLRLLYALLFAVPGIPCLYYGSEWGATGVKQRGASDEALRPAFDAPSTNALSGFIAHLSGE
jgi:glycosidase